MPSQDYVTPTSGSLRLKGVGPPSKISKGKKKKKNRERTEMEKEVILSEAPDNKETAKHVSDEENIHSSKDHGGSQAQSPQESTDGKAHAAEGEDEDGTRARKTEAELRHVERRRKRVSNHLSLSSPTVGIGYSPTSLLLTLLKINVVPFSRVPSALSSLHFFLFITIRRSLWTSRY